jgi:Flp pilus assembly protein TadB
MSPTLLGAFAGMAIAVGLYITVIGALATPTAPIATPHTPRRRNVTVNVRALLIGTVVGVGVAVLTGWWSIAVLAAMGSWLLPAMHAERAGQQRDRKRVAAVASWIETVRDLLSAASGIDEAINRSAQTLPVTSPIHAEVRSLAATSGLGGLRQGLRRFADQMADPTVDYVTATLLIATERSSGALAEQLSKAAEVAREQVSARERIDASRSRMRTAAIAIVAVTVVMVVFVIGTQPSYAAWYAHTTGQTVLSIAGIIELGGLWWMARLARPEPGTRITLDTATPMGSAR